MFKKFCRSIISGSLAAFVIVVVPLANTLASIAFSVAPTLGKSRSIFSPFIFSALHSMFPWFWFASIPSFSKLFRCKSIGLDPMSHPPVCDSLWVHKF